MQKNKKKNGTDTIYTKKKMFYDRPMIEKNMNPTLMNEL